MLIVIDMRMISRITARDHLFACPRDNCLALNNVTLNMARIAVVSIICSATNPSTALSIDRHDEAS